MWEWLHQPCAQRIGRVSNKKCWYTCSTDIEISLPHRICFWDAFLYMHEFARTRASCTLPGQPIQPQQPPATTLNTTLYSCNNQYGLMQGASQECDNHQLIQHTGSCPIYLVLRRLSTIALQVSWTITYTVHLAAPKNVQLFDIQNKLLSTTM